MKTYSEKLKDPRWQRKRLEIMERDNFTCTECGDNKNTLNVHHWNYSKEPWDAKNEDLSTVCRSCHELIEARKKNNLPTRAGHGYRFLNDNEIIENGDEWFAAGRGYIKFGKAIGSKYRKTDWVDFPAVFRLPCARKPIY